MLITLLSVRTESFQHAPSSTKLHASPTSVGFAGHLTSNFQLKPKLLHSELALTPDARHHSVDIIAKAGGPACSAFHHVYEFFARKTIASFTVGTALVSVLILFLRRLLWKPSRTYNREENSVGKEYDAWATEGILESYWGEHIHLGCVNHQTLFDWSIFSYFLFPCAQILYRRGEGNWVQEEGLYTGKV
jgi:hypothetical protein